LQIQPELAIKQYAVSLQHKRFTKILSQGDFGGGWHKYRECYPPAMENQRGHPSNLVRQASVSMKSTSNIAV
jgi:hypothetical protein